MSDRMALRTSPPLARPVVGELLRVHASQRPNKPFLVCGDSTRTYAETYDIAQRLAHGFSRLGVGPGDRVGLLAPNRVEMLELYFGLALLGAVQVPFNAFLRGRFLHHQLVDSGVEIIVADDAGCRQIARAAGEDTALRAVVALDHTAVDGVPAVVPYEDLRSVGPAGPLPIVEPGDLMSILYTSGTTGLPKGCMLPHGYYVRVGELVATAIEQTERDVLFTALPLFHAMARMMVVGAALTRGSTVVVEEAFRASGFLDRAARVGATLAFGVGATGLALLGTPESPEDRAHGIRAMLIGPFGPGHQQRFRDRFGIDAWAEMYGQTECTSITWNPIGGPRHHTTVGRPSPDLDVRILDESGTEVGVGVAGEICLRPKHQFAMFSGYWGNPAATVAATSGLWYHTGDLGRVDEHGCVTFIDRKKDALRRAGENISSQELEVAIAEHPAVAEVAVHAVSNDSAEDLVMAVIVPVAGATPTPRELFDHFSGTLPYFAIPRYVRLIDELPKNAASRVMKHQLRDLPIDDAVWDLEAMGFVVARADRR